MKGYGRTQLLAQCSACGRSVTIYYVWDRSTGYKGYEDTEHKDVDGSNCDLSDADIDRATETEG